MKRKAKTSSERDRVSGRTTYRPTLGLFAVALATISLALSLGSAGALASKQVVDYIGNGSSGTQGGAFGGPVGVAVNNSGAGPANKGDIYVTDGDGNNRIQRFGRDDKGTPADSSDDSYFFISAWGAGVDSKVGGSGYQVCTVADDCQAGIGSGGNGALGRGAVGLHVAGVAVDQDSGDVYVSDAANFRVNVYEGDGAFRRSFGFDVVASGPDDNGVDYEVCVAANGDVCKNGLSGSAVGQIADGGAPSHPTAQGIAVSQPDGDSTTGTVFLTDPGNRRVDTYHLDGSSPSSFGSAAVFSQERPDRIAVDSRGIVYASNQKNSNEIERYDSQSANGGGIGFLAPLAAPPLLPSADFGEGVTGGLSVDPDSDGAGPDTDVLYASRYDGVGNATRAVQQFGPLNPPGLTLPPTAVDDTHGMNFIWSGKANIASDDSSGRLFVTGRAGAAGENGAEGVFVLDVTGPPPTAVLDPTTPVDSITSTTATIHAEIDPNGPPALSYRVEYSLDGSNWQSAPSTLLGAQETPQAVNPVLDPPAGGLQPGTTYHVRVVAARPFFEPVVSGVAIFATLPAKPGAETTGSPLRTATTAQLEGRVNPRNAATTYHFEFGDQGPCDANPCTSTEPQPAGSGHVVEFASQLVEGLQPATTYHYRLIADNGTPGSPSSGADMTLTTRASDAPLDHGHLAGPPGSDRAYEQVNLPDTSGNPIFGALGFSDDGNRALYRIAGGTPLSDTGSFAGIYFAQRTETAEHEGGWRTERITPPRSELIGSDWEEPAGSSDLSSVASLNSATSTLGAGTATAWRFGPGTAPIKLFEAVPPQQYRIAFGVSGDGTRVVELLDGGQLDPAYPEAAGRVNLYDVSTGATPRLVSLLPDGGVPACGTEESQLGYGIPSQATHWISNDGSRIFFPSSGSSCGGPTQFYMRDVGAGQTKLISGPTVSGLSCGVAFLKATPGAAFFWTQSRLAPEDTVPGGCNGTTPLDGDVYRYDLGDGTLDCVTCAAAGLDANVFIQPNNKNAGPVDVAVSEDGSRVYFRTQTHLRAGAVPEGEFGAYRVDVSSGDLAYVGPISTGRVGTVGDQGNAISHTGSVLVFRSDDSGLNQLGGQENGATAQYYRYDDRDRSLTCVSCPNDGSAPRGDAYRFLGSGENLNLGALSADGSTLAFGTPTALLGTDQNSAGAGQDSTAGEDIYEWRDGHLLLITDGLTNWANESQPKVRGVSPSGRDVYFTAAARYTPDALDGYTRLYDARIGGGFAFPSPPQPCPLEVCQGTPKGAPDEPPPGSAGIAGEADSVPQRSSRRSRKRQRHKQRHKHRHKKVKRHASHHGRASR